MLWRWSQLPLNWRTARPKFIGHGPTHATCCPAYICLHEFDLFFSSPWWCDFAAHRNVQLKWLQLSNVIRCFRFLSCIELAATHAPSRNFRRFLCDALPCAALGFTMFCTDQTKTGGQTCKPNLECKCHISGKHWTHEIKYNQTHVLLKNDNFPWSCDKLSDDHTNSWIHVAELALAHAKRGGSTLALWLMCG